MDLLAGQAAADEPFDGRRLGEGGVGAQGGAQLARRPHAEVGDQALDGLVAAGLDDRLDLGVAPGPWAPTAARKAARLRLTMVEPAVDRRLGVLGGHRREAQHRADDLAVEVALGAEVVVQQPARDAGLAGDLGRRDLAGRALGEQPAGGREDLLAALVVIEP